MQKCCKVGFTIFNYYRLMPLNMIHHRCWQHVLAGAIVPVEISFKPILGEVLHSSSSISLQMGVIMPKFLMLALFITENHHKTVFKSK